jgi:hypothetical protein
MPIPSYADICPRVIQWAVDRGLLNSDGTAAAATPYAQHQKTLEEIAEAQQALEAFEDTPDTHRALALEFGDVLVTLTIQAVLQGTTLEDCIAIAGRISAPVQRWEFVGTHAGGLGIAIANYSKRTPAFIGAVATCVEDEARTQLALLGPECMALALEKISKRTGEVVDGAFVKSECLLPG